MRERGDSTPQGGGAPAVNGAWVSIFVGDDHPLLRLKQALDWAAITAVMVTHWRTAGKNVDGGPGRPWPVPLYAPLLVLMWVKAYHARQMEDYLSESVVARRFLDLPHPQVMHVRDHSNIARAEAALAGAGRAAINALIIRTATAVGFTDSKILSSDTTVQEPAIGYPNEPGLLKGLAQRIERASKKLRGRGVAARADENQMPQESLKDYRELFGEKATPQMVVYDRGASLAAAAPQLQAAGVKKVGIPPRGKGAWRVGEKDQQVVKSERGKTEGSLGRLKSRKYGF